MTAPRVWWRTDQLTSLDSALADAAAGQPTLLWIEGEPGQGKTSLLREMESRAAGFTILRAVGAADVADSPFALVQQLLDRFPRSRSDPFRAGVSPFQAAQQVRELLDRLTLTGPAMIMVDDFQLVDHESAETLAWVLRRAHGDRLLIVVASRPISRAQNQTWRRLLLSEPSVQVRLDGLRENEARLLIEELRPGVDPAVSARLIAHTGGNPLYLRALLNEHDPATFVGLERLPAPEDLTAIVARRLQRLPVRVAEVITAVAVLGGDWIPLARLTDLVDIDGLHDLIHSGVRAGLLVQESADPSSHVRVVHAVVQSAVLAAQRPEQLRLLRLRAAETASGQREALRYRIAATVGYDDTLAGELAEFASMLHQRSEYCEAGRFFVWSSSFTTNPRRREQRWLDGQFEYVLGRDDEAVAAGRRATLRAEDDVRRSLVLAGDAILTRRWSDAGRILDAVAEAAVEAADPLPRYRLMVLRCWGRIMCGRGDRRALTDLAWCNEADQPDPALYAYLAIASSLARLIDRHAGDRSAVASQPLTPTSTTDLTQLAWRGTFYAVSGRFDDGIAVLRGVTAGIRDGLTGFGDGVFHAYLGYAYWMRADWSNARRVVTLASDARFGRDHPTVAAMSALLSVATHDETATAQALREAESVLRAAPFPPAVRIAAQARVLLTRLVGETDAQSRVLSELGETFGAAVTCPGIDASPVWLLHLGFAAVWAGEPELAEKAAERLRGQSGWLLAASDWLDGLVAESRGDWTKARVLLTASAGGQLDALPLYQGLIYDDVARVEEQLGHKRAAAKALQDSRAKLTTLGLLIPAESTERASDVLKLLSDRERDVVGLLVDGLSYAQIARELYVTRDTVAYHLSNAYAKTHTTNRHQLTSLIRGLG